MCSLIQLRREFFIFFQYIDILFDGPDKSCTVFLETQELRKLSGNIETDLYLFLDLLETIQLRLLFCIQCSFRFYAFQISDLFGDRFGIAYLVF